MILLRDVMSRLFDSIGPDAGAAEALRKMDAQNFRELPVCEGDRVVGLLVDRELREAASRPGPLRVRDVMRREFDTGREDGSLARAVARMRDRDLALLPVLDARRRMLGVFTLGGPWRRRR
jgi:acetoin utilization protein AcuB